MTSRIQRDEGATLVLVAVFLIGLLAFISLAVDGGRALAERRDVRNVADHAAMNAAWASCNGNSPQAAADTSVERNGFPSSQLLLTHLGGHTYRARVESALSTGFAGIVGIDQLDVAGVATADCELGAGVPGYAIFAGGDTCFDDGKAQVDIPGSDQNILGNVHSNNNVKMGGANNDFRGMDNLSEVPPYPFTNPPVENEVYEFTFVVSPPPNDIDDFDPPSPDYGTSNGNVFDTGYPTPASVIDPWPISAPFTIDDVSGGLGGTASFWEDMAYKSEAANPGHQFYFNGDIKADDMKSGSTYVDGVYFSKNGNIELDHSDMGTAGDPFEVTVVSQNGFVKISGSNQHLEPFTGHSELASNSYTAYAGVQFSGVERCDKFGITLSGSTSSWNGTFFAPRSLVEMNGSDNSTIEEGSLIGWAVRLNGQNITIRAPQGGGTSGPNLRLLS